MQAIISARRKINPGQQILMLQLLLLAVAAILLYGNFLSSPLVFDDRPFFQNSPLQFQQTIFSLDLRWFPYASFGWAQTLQGETLWWWHLGNLALHITNVFLLLLLLRRLFTTLLTGEHVAVSSSVSGISLQENISRKEVLSFKILGIITSISSI